MNSSRRPTPFQRRRGLCHRLRLPSVSIKLYGQSIIVRVIIIPIRALVNDRRIDWEARHAEVGSKGEDHASGRPCRRQLNGQQQLAAKRRLLR